MEALFSTLVVLLICIFFYHLKRSKNKKSTTPLPEANGGWPVIGHMLCFRSPKPFHDKLTEMADEYGPAFTIRMGSHRILVLSSLELAKECFTTHDRVFSNRPNLTSSKLIGYDHAMFGITPDQTYWRDARKMAVGKLLSNRRLDMLSRIRASEVEMAVRELYKNFIDNGEPKNGVLVDMEKWVADMVNNFFVRLLGGKRYFGANPDVEEGEAKRCRKLVEDVFHVYFMSFMFSDQIPYLGWLDNLIGSKKAMKEYGKEIDSLVGGWLEEHKQKRLLGVKVKEQEEDFIDVMLNNREELSKMSDYAPDTIIKATCINFMGAGSDTIQIGVKSALRLVINNPDVLRKAQEELDTHVGKDRCVDESDINNLTYLQAIVKEVLRHDPPTHLIGLRVSTEDITLSTGQHVPAGTDLIINSWKVHHDEKAWSNPNEFQPERFLSDYKDRDVKGRNYEFIPFGSGRRVCIGMSLAMRMLSLSLASLLQSFEFSKADSSGLKFRLKPRLDPKLYVH
ncbi:cytochrome P450 CYP82D47-like [Tripterygium wilfordii]|uniref:Cytochrome P450 CYP82D47-like n=1 Tax=Tripterygium wilfordii TaxID=458696 RepID=A0A7J7CMA5_TRIWF|nr:cytochrome P450 CYP82D47-like [Tripterygium wilfordii]KAF5735227.1 cytochrome P450 CYP82D47-like [Tripterygium wilfordii]